MPALTHIALGLAALLATQPAPACPPLVGSWHVADVTPPAVAADRWFGDDKLQHFTMSFAATSFAFATARSIGVGEPAAPAGAAAALVAGIAKEVWDVRGGGSFSLRDLVWDAAGILAGYALARSGH